MNFLRWVFGIAGALFVHALILLFGGIFLPDTGDGKGKLQEVELVGDDVASAKEKEKPKEAEPEKKKDEIDTDQEKPPDSAEIIRSLEATETAAPALEAASLSAIEQALNGQGGASDFGDALTFASGGRIGGLGKPGAQDDKLDSAFNLNEIDQKPRVVYQSSPLFPAEMRGKKIEGLVTVLFVVDSSGKVVDPRVQKSSHPAFEKPALEAIRHWKFDPAVKGGQRVGCRMLERIRFPAD